MNTFWFSFLVLKEGKRLECVCGEGSWGGECVQLYLYSIVGIKVISMLDYEDQSMV